MSYQDPIIQKYIDLFEANGLGVKKYYHGEPVRVPASELPVAMISKRGTKVGPFNNADDEQEIALTITVITDIRADLSTEESQGDIAAGIATLYEIIEGRNTDFTLKSNTVLDILRGNITLDAVHNLRTDIGSITSVDYGLTFANRAPDQWTIEARVDFVAHFVQTR